MSMHSINSHDHPLHDDTSKPISMATVTSEHKAGMTEAVHAESEYDYPHGLRLTAIVGSLLLGMFLVSLDNTIISTAIPKITDEFKDLNKVSWYGTAYFMTFGGFQSTWGKFYKYFPIKLWYLVAMLIFEVGSLICATAPNPVALIIGRAIAGVGGSGIAVGIFTMLGFIAAPAQRPTLLGYTGATYGIAAVLGPLVGGALTERASWRYCFYINLPIGGLAAVIVFFFFKTPSHVKPAEATFKEKMLQLDLVGAALIMALIIMYTLALQYGGQIHPWKSSVVIGLLVGAFLVFLVFVAWEIYQKERAMIVRRLFLKQSIWVGGIYMFFFGGAYFSVLYYLPIYFQSVYNTSPIGSGVRMLALIIPLTIAAIFQGIALMKIGIVPLFWIIGGALGAVGSGLFYTMTQYTSTGKWIGYQIIVGFTTGWTFQVALSNAQVHATPEDMSQVSAIINFFVTVGGAFFLSASQSAFDNQLILTLRNTLPDVDASAVLGIGATQIRQVFTPAQVPLVIDAYVVGLKSVWAICAAAYAVCAIIGCFGSWKKLHGEDLAKATGGA